MSYHDDMVDAGYTPVSAAEIDARVGFIRKTYAHLGGAVLAFIGLEALLLQLDITRQAIGALFSIPYAWAGVLIVFALVGMIADWWANNMESRPLQYLGLGLYVVAEAVIFAPLLFLVQATAGGAPVIPMAGILTVMTFAGLTVGVFATRKDFSFLRTGLAAGMMLALGLIVASLIFGFSLGLLFSGFMVLLAAGSILYYTSNVLYHYRTDQHVAASLALFSAVALLFWYIVRIVWAITSD